MNLRARDVLVEAAMKGVPQVKGKLGDGQGGFCATGWLIEAMRQRDGWEWSTCAEPTCRCVIVPGDYVFGQMRHEYGMTVQEHWNLVHANNELGWDWMTIARKFGVEEEV